MTHPAGSPTRPPALGHWAPGGEPPSASPEAFREALGDLRSPVVVVRDGDGFAVARGGSVALGAGGGQEVAAYLPPLPPEQLGDPTFAREHGLRYPYMTGAMANGIASVEIVEAISKGGMLGSFGAAGQSLARIGEAVDRLKANLGGAPYCVNLIHSPGEPAHEMATAELL
jgi:hypothetical protein